MRFLRTVRLLCQADWPETQPGHLLKRLLAPRRLELAFSHRAIGL